MTYERMLVEIRDEYKGANGRIRARALVKRARRKLGEGLNDPTYSDAHRNWE